MFYLKYIIVYWHHILKAINIQIVDISYFTYYAFFPERMFEKLYLYPQEFVQKIINFYVLIKITVSLYIV